MECLWEPYGKGVPFLGAPGNSLEYEGNKERIQIGGYELDDEPMKSGVFHQTCTKQTHTV